MQRDCNSRATITKLVRRRLPALRNSFVVWFRESTTFHFRFHRRFILRGIFRLAVMFLSRRLQPTTQEASPQQWKLEAPSLWILRVTWPWNYQGLSWKIFIKEIIQKWALYIMWNDCTTQEIGSTNILQNVVQILKAADVNASVGNLKVCRCTKCM